MFTDEEVLRVVNVLVGTGLDRLENSRLQVNQNGARNVSSVVTLVEEDIFPIASLGGKVRKVTIRVDTVFQAELLPELGPDVIAALPASAFNMVEVRTTEGILDQLEWL